MIVEETVEGTVEEAVPVPRAATRKAEGELDECLRLIRYREKRGCAVVGAP